MILIHNCHWGKKQHIVATEIMFVNMRSIQSELQASRKLQAWYFVLQDGLSIVRAYCMRGNINLCCKISKGSKATARGLEAIASRKHQA